MTQLDDLEDWIENNYTSIDSHNPSYSHSPLYLFSPTITLTDLIQAETYARCRHYDALASWSQAELIRETQYHHLIPATQPRDGEPEPVRYEILVRRTYDGEPFWLRDLVALSYERERRWRIRVILWACRMRREVERVDGELRRMIVEVQDG